MGPSLPALFAPFTPSHRGGAGAPPVCLHGFTDTWRSWELVLSALERRHDVLAVTLAGHAGGPPIGAKLSLSVLADAVAADLILGFTARRAGGRRRALTVAHAPRRS